MDRATAIRFLALYLPIVAAFALALARPRTSRLLPACLLGFAWSLPALLALQLLNLHFAWWRFHAQGGLLRQMPVDLYLGWAVLWGIVPILAFRRVKIPWVVAIFAALDLLLMPACFPVVVLTRSWLVGEFAAISLVLVPALLFARWTFSATNLPARATLQVFTSGALFLFLVPEIIFAATSGRGWNPFFSQSRWLTNLELQMIALLALAGVSAVQEFVLRGEGTPLPFDSPRRLVTSGIYRYISNPMQLSCALVVTAWGAVVRSPWIALAGVTSFIYSAGLANWDEGADLQVRFGEPWLRYRRHVRPWRPRVHPWHDPELPFPRLYVAEACGPCSEVRRWFIARHAFALEIVPAEDHPARDLERMTYDPMDGSQPEDGIRAFARGLEHINLGWALAGAMLRLPGISHFVQLLLDASGLGPRTIPRRHKTCLIPETPARPLNSPTPTQSTLPARAPRRGPATCCLKSL
ncbi:MAG: methyltransferase [Candidatus Acidiferrales bacterium]